MPRNDIPVPRHDPRMPHCGRCKKQAATRALNVLRKIGWRTEGGYLCYACHKRHLERAAKERLRDGSSVTALALDSEPLEDEVARSSRQHAPIAGQYLMMADITWPRE